MLSIRLMPVGKKHQRSFRVVVDERRHKLKGKNLEDLGWYNPHTNSFNLNNERILHWMNNGAQPTDTTHNLLVRSGVIRGKKISVHSKTKKKEKPESAETATGKEAKADETPKAEAEGSKPKNEVTTSGGALEEKQEEVKAEEAPIAESSEKAPVAEVKEDASAEDKKEESDPPSAEESK